MLEVVERGLEETITYVPGAKATRENKIYSLYHHQREIHLMWPYIREMWAITKVTTYNRSRVFACTTSF